MKATRMLPTMVSLLLVAMLLASCGGAAAPAGTSGGGQAAGGKPYIPIISKGFQHQFWQAVKQGAEKAATEFNVTITFEGPESESQVDKQIEMLQAALDKKPQAICFAALDQGARVNGRLLWVDALGVYGVATSPGEGFQVARDLHFV